MVHSLYSDKLDENGYFHRSTLEENKKFYAPSKSEFMVNYRVDDLVTLLKALREEEVEIVRKMEEYEYDKFVWILDLDGYKIELWEPVDSVLPGNTMDRLPADV